EALAAIDADLALLEQEHAKEQAGLAQKRERRDDLVQRLTALKASLAEMETSRSDVMTEMRQMNVQIERSRDKMSRCRNEKESLAVQRELEELRRLMRDREIDAEKLGQLIEQAKGDISKLESELKQLEADLGLVEGPAQERLSSIQTKLDGKKAERKSITSKIKPQTLSRYDMIRKRRGSAVASTTHGTCSACHISLPPMMFQQLMRQEQLGQCPQCNRILYFRPPASIPPNGSEEE
ncbi:MAG TPA: C4-type zinc ribbon domain-containing protein, partial [Polyangiaceae bacterium]|nr:C4-type zinc ribbon domain-containing protein [Polyangiaceae bacterium]